MIIDMETGSQTLNALILVNSGSPDYAEGIERVIMYMEHFGVPYDLIDVLHEPLEKSLNIRPLIFLAHPRLDHTGSRFGSRGRAALHEALRQGTGVVSFDPSLSAYLAGGDEGQPRPVNQLEIAPAGHIITAMHCSGQSYKLERTVNACDIPGEALLVNGSQTFLGVKTVEQGRLLTWASTDWMDTRVLGPMAGLDDLFWRGIVWAARKPFCIRGLPPLVTMRVDDVAGRGALWDQSPLYWVEDCVNLGWKPWLGLFIYNNDPGTVRQLQGFTSSGHGTVFPHAFGRPNRNSDDNFYYYENALPFRADHYDEFIYFNHQAGRPWSDAEARRGLEAVDEWLAAHAPLPVSRVALPHWYEMGINTAAHIAERWGCDMLGKPMEADLPFVPGISWWNLKPFRSFEPPGDCAPSSPDYRARRALYYADFVTLDGFQFFNSLTEIHDDAGYEWAPDNDVEATIKRGVRQLRRALDSMAMSSLFTHETDYIYKIRPDNWAAIMEGVTEGIKAYQPWMVTLDEGQQILRATRTSRLARVSREPSGTIIAIFEGQADCATGFYCFTDDTLNADLIEAPAFDGRVSVRVP